MKREILRWSRVKEDLVAHFAYIAQDKIEPAERLALNPLIGLRWKSKKRQLRGIRFYPLPSPYRSYIVFYRASRERIEIITVLHGARDLESALSDVIE
jgi:plasmid stabilization system protein ParE